MSLEDRGAQHDKVIVDKFIDPVVAVAMTTRDYVVRPSAAAAMVITLPRVAEAKGRWYSILARAATAVNTITITDHGSDSECWLGDIVLDGICDRALLYSDGLCWHCMANPGSWPGFDTTAAPGTTEVPTTVATTRASQTTVAPTTIAPTTTG